MKKCCMDDCDNDIDIEKDFLFDDERGKYACDSCMDELGDE